MLPRVLHVTIKTDLKKICPFQKGDKIIGKLLNDASVFSPLSLLNWYNLQWIFKKIMC